MVLGLLKSLGKKPAATEFFKFDDAALQEIALAHRERYIAAQPFAHTYIDNFLPESVAEQLVSVFPTPEDPVWFDWRQGDTVHQPKKLGTRHASRMEGAHPLLHNLCYAFNAYPFIHFLETLSGFGNLLPDPCLRGGGLHQILSGGSLDVHKDFNFVKEYGLYRKLNAILYLNKDWQPSYGGNLELWDKEMSRAEAKIAPMFNRLAIFSTIANSYHGHPEPLACPDTMTRKSMAFYYFSSQGEADDAEPHNVLWQTRPAGQTP